MHFLYNFCVTLILRSARNASSPIGIISLTFATLQGQIIWRKIIIVMTKVYKQVSTLILCCLVDAFVKTTDQRINNN